MKLELKTETLELKAPSNIAPPYADPVLLVKFEPVTVKLDLIPKI